MCTCTLHSPQELRRAPRNRFVAVSPLATAPTAEEQEEGGLRNQREWRKRDQGYDKEEGICIVWPTNVLFEWKNFSSGFLLVEIFALRLNLFFCWIFPGKEIAKFLGILLKLLLFDLINKFIYVYRKKFLSIGRGVNSRFSFHSYGQVISVMERFYPVAWSFIKDFVAPPRSK